MTRLSALLTILVAAVPVLAAQPADLALADSALVARIYADLARGDVEAVVAVLDDHVLWTEGGHSPQGGRHFGPGTVAAQVLRPQADAGIADVLEAVTSEGSHVVAVGTTRRDEPATDSTVVARFRHLWQVLDGRVVSVHRGVDGPERPATTSCGPAPC